MRLTGRDVTWVAERREFGKTGGMVNGPTCSALAVRGHG
jgi:hypothetical protein